MEHGAHTVSFKEYLGASSSLFKAACNNSSSIIF